MLHPWRLGSGREKVTQESHELSYCQPHWHSLVPYATTVSIHTDRTTKGFSDMMQINLLK